MTTSAEWVLEAAAAFVASCDAMPTEGPVDGTLQRIADWRPGHDALGEALRLAVIAWGNDLNIEFIRQSDPQPTAGQLAAVTLARKQNLAETPEGSFEERCTPYQDS